MLNDCKRVLRKHMRPRVEMIREEDEEQLEKTISVSKKRIIRKVDIESLERDMRAEQMEVEEPPQPNEGDECDKEL